MAEKAENGRKKVVKELSRLAFMEPEEGCRIKISEKMKALELLGKCLDMFEAPEPVDSDLNVQIKIVDEFLREHGARFWAAALCAMQKGEA